MRPLTIEEITKHPKFACFKHRQLEDGCWEHWAGKNRKGGYPQIRWDGARQQAHRVMYALYYGECPKGAYIMHLCNNKACCNPSHLFAGNSSENQKHRFGVLPFGLQFR